MTIYGVSIKSLAFLSAYHVAANQVEGVVGILFVAIAAVLIIKL